MNLLFTLLFFLLSQLVYGQTFSIKNINGPAQLSGGYTAFELPQKNIQEAIENYKTKNHTLNLKEIERSFSSDESWYVFSVKNEMNVELKRVLQYPFGCTDELELFEIDKNFNVLTYEVRKHSTPLEQRKFNARRLTVEFTIKPGEEKTFIAKLRSRHIIGMNFDIESPEMASYYEQRYKVLSILYTGIVFGLFFYNLFFVLTARDNVTYYYIGMLISISSLILVVGDVPAFFDMTVPYFFHKTLPLHHASVIVFSCLFAMSFLNTKNNFKKIHLSFKLFMTLGSIAGVISMFDFSYSLGNQILKNILTLLLVLSIVSSAYIAIKTRQRPAIIYFFAIGALLGSGLMYLLTWNYGLLERNFYTANIILVGSAIEMILFSIAIADKFEFKAKRELEKRLEAEQSLKELNFELESKVKEKTNELLKAKRRAALGEMAGSVAHELNSPLAAVFNNNQRVIKLLSKDELKVDKVQKTAVKIESILESIFDITNNLQVYGDDYEKYETRQLDLNKGFLKAIDNIKNLGIELNDYKLSLDDIQIDCKSVPFINSISILLKYLTVNSSRISIQAHRGEGLFYIDLSSDGEPLPKWVDAYLLESFSKQTGEVKGSGLELSIVKDTFDSLGIEIQISTNEQYKFRLVIPNELISKRIA